MMSSLLARQPLAHARGSVWSPILSRDRQGADARLLRNMWRWAALAAGLAVLWSFTPPDLPLCGFRWLTGRPCPFCGLTHAVFALAKGRWAEALHWHALSPLAVVMLAGWLWNPPRLARLWMPCAAAFGAYGVWRIVLGTGHF